MLINHTHSPELEQAAQQAYEAYPALQAHDIHLRFKELNGPTMAAQPTKDLVWLPAARRSYQIVMHPHPTFANGEPLQQLPEAVLVGWLAHEMGHLMDYRPRNRWGMLRFLLGYLLSPRYRRRAEKVADTFAVNHGLGEFILKTKLYLVEHQNLSLTYKARLMKHYLSPEEIIAMIEDQEGPLLPE